MRPWMCFFQQDCPCGPGQCPAQGGQLSMHGQPVCIYVVGPQTSLSQIEAWVPPFTLGLPGYEFTVLCEDEKSNFYSAFHMLIHNI
jgi:hypothetical protein